MAESRPGISVIIPVYNRAGLVVEALGSVFGQSLVVAAESGDGGGGVGGRSASGGATGEGGGSAEGAAATRLDPLVEVIVVDDGSTDGTGAAVEAAAERAPASVAVRLELLGHSGYPGRVRNRGASMARGELLAFLDADDLWLPEKLARQERLHRMHGYELTHTRERWEREGRTISQRKQRHRRQGFVFDESLVKCILGPSTVMVCRSTFERVGGFREDVEIAEDYECFLRLTDHVPVGYLSDELTVKRAGSGDQLSEKYGQIEGFRLQALQDLVDGGYWKDRPPLARAAALELARKCRIYAHGCRKRERAAEATQHEEAAMQYEQMARAYAEGAASVDGGPGAG